MVSSMYTYGGFKNHDYVQAGFGVLGMFGSASQFYNSFSVTMYHYTDEAGHSVILNSNMLKPSRGFQNARYGNGQYFVYISPTMVAGMRAKDITEMQKLSGGISMGQLSKIMYC